MCGVVGIVSKTAVNHELYNALTILQHRGQDAAGIMTSDGQRVHLRKGNGLVRDVIRDPHMLTLLGNVGIGHVRYPTAGSESVLNSQPLYVNSPYGLSLVHNGNLINTESLADDLVKEDLRHLNTNSDSEIILNVFAHELQLLGRKRFSKEALFSATKAMFSRIQGAYAGVIMIHGHGLLGFRDPFGIRPLVYGKRRAKGSRQADYMLASESIALDALGYELVGDVAPGEAVFISLDGKLHKKSCVKKAMLTPCLFEYIYLARPDSLIDHISVHQARINMGKCLADQVMEQHPEHDIDAVIPIPDTSRTAALPLALRLGVRYAEGFVKNRYIPRTFIMAKQNLRRSAIRLKLNAIKQEFEGKNVLLVDDSIVRGNTSKEIIQMARDAGAKKVYFASASPEVRFPNVYGIDMSVAEELIAHHKTAKAIGEDIGADWLVFQKLADVIEAVKKAAHNKAQVPETFETSIFTGDYITGGVDAAYLKHLAKRRADSVKEKASQDDDSSILI